MITTATVNADIDFSSSFAVRGALSDAAFWSSPQRLKTPLFHHLPE
ncbi:hypothetical protein EM595_p0183 (plasmid) [Duffyella gerundensis]|uniref:Uncharacterized protein n=1 Tax=Duffyella gerundensis TaxID=1619313 RepID=A0A0U5L9Q7_9GAMM|nr:hypothetical protein EM595_p0183 [Duffyella gerundensis]